MAYTLAAADPMCLSSDHTGHDLTMSMRPDQWDMSLAIMPLTPPSSLDELPHLAGAGHGKVHQHSLMPEFTATYHTVRKPGVNHDPASMNMMADDAQLFEHALMAMRRDQQEYHNEETKSRGHEFRTQPMEGSVVQKRESTTKGLSRVKKAQTKQAVRPPALAATHPALYKASTPPRNHQPQIMLPTPPPETRDDCKIPAQLKSMPPPKTPRPVPVVPWKVYTDPNKLISAEPQFDDPMYRMLRMDVNPDQPTVISPLFMIGMPCGSLVEAANYYGNDDTFA